VALRDLLQRACRFDDIPISAWAVRDSSSIDGAANDASAFPLFQVEWREKSQRPVRER